jgi:hypothetical protein
MANSFFRVRKGLTVANSSASANIDPISLTIGALVANSSGVFTPLINSTTSNTGSYQAGAFTANNTLVTAAALNVTNQVNTATFNATTSANVGTTQLTTTNLVIGVAAANLFANSILLKVANATNIANLTPSTLSVANVVLSGTIQANGALGSSGWILKTSGTVAYWEAASAANPAGANTQIQFNDSLTFGTNAWFTFDKNTTTLLLGNSTVNTVVNNTILKIANATNIANLTPTSLALGVTVINTTATAIDTIGVNVGSLQTNALFKVGNSSINATMNSTVFNATANNATFLGGVAAASYQGTANLAAAVALISANNASFLGGTAAASYQLNSTLSANVATMTANNSTNLGGQAAANYARLNLADQTVSGGARVTELGLGTGAGTMTPDPGDRPMQLITNNGAFTLAPGTNVGAYILTISNGATAGTITTSGWTKVAGDAFTTTSGNKFRCHCSVGADGSLLVVQAMQ